MPSERQKRQRERHAEHSDSLLRLRLRDNLRDPAFVQWLLAKVRAYADTDEAFRMYQAEKLLSHVMGRATSELAHHNEPLPYHKRQFMPVATCWPVLSPAEAMPPGTVGGVAHRSAWPWMPLAAPPYILPYVPSAPSLWQPEMLLPHAVLPALMLPMPPKPPAAPSPHPAEEVPPMPAGAFVKQEEVPPMPAGAFVKQEEIPPMPAGAFVKQGGPAHASRCFR